MSAIITKLKKVGTAGTLESSDIMVTVHPRKEEGIRIILEAPVKQRFEKAITAVIKDALRDLGITSALVDAKDQGALDCTIRARTEVAVKRAAGLDTVEVSK